jgi:alcohol dehydrogenase (NADP+)
MRVRRMAGSNIGSIHDIKELLEVASKRNVRPMIQKLPLAKVKWGSRWTVRYRVVLEN